jgi:ADP-heptose:LPS heptosyltransferase
MILISPWAKPLRNGNANPKNYPYWKELIAQIEEPVIQVGVDGEQQLVDDFRKNLSFDELGKLVNECRTWISVDSFFQHFCWDLGKQGIVLWGQSDPNIFGHFENINLLKGRSYLMPNQFVTWEMVPYKTECFVPPEEVIKYLYYK